MTSMYLDYRTQPTPDSQAKVWREFRRRCRRYYHSLKNIAPSQERRVEFSREARLVVLMLALGMLAIAILACVSVEWEAAEHARMLVPMGFSHHP